MDDSQRLEQASKEQIRHYRELQKVADSEDFQKFFETLMSTIAHKIIWGFGTHKSALLKRDVDNIKDWDEFCKWRGEIIARLQPIQEINGSSAMVNYLEEQLKQYYGTKQPKAWHPWYARAYIKAWTKKPKQLGTRQPPHKRTR